MEFSTPAYNLLNALEKIGYRCSLEFLLCISSFPSTFTPSWIISFNSYNRVVTSSSFISGQQKFSTKDFIWTLYRSSYEAEMGWTSEHSPQLCIVQTRSRSHHSGCWHENIGLRGSLTSWLNSFRFNLNLICVWWMTKVNFLSMLTSHNVIIFHLPLSSMQYIINSQRRVLQSVYS